MTLSLNGYLVQTMVMQVGYTDNPPPEDVYELLRQGGYGETSPDYVLGKHYIHPDLLDLLEPQVGDAVEFDCWFFERIRNAEYKNYPYQSHYGRLTPFGRNDEYLGITSDGVCWDNTSENAGFTLPFKIVQRQRLPLKWPESEEVFAISSLASSCYSPRPPRGLDAEIAFSPD
jgi:hypothetical protein